MALLVLLPRLLLPSAPLAAAPIVLLVVRSTVPGALLRNGRPPWLLRLEPEPGSEAPDDLACVAAGSVKWLDSPGAGVGDCFGT